jgi:hypothetical protein
MRKSHRPMLAACLGMLAAASAAGCTDSPVSRKNRDGGDITVVDNDGAIPPAVLDATTGDRAGPDGARLDTAAVPDAARASADADVNVSPGADGGRDAGAGPVDTALGDGARTEDQTQKSCIDYWSITCQRYAECAPFILKRDYGDIASCTMSGMTSCLAKDNPAAAVLPAMLAACTDERRKSPCGDFLSGALLSCRLAGPRANGVRCAHNRDCQSSRCEGSGPEACGTCGGISSAGGPCDAARDCAPGLVCDTGGHCAPPVAPCKTCASSKDCGTGAFCNAARTCAPLVTTANGKCEPGGCDLFRELSCHPVTNVCVPVELAKPGQECGLLDTKEVVCAAGNCPPPAGTVRGVCPRVVAAGAACNDGDVCASDTVCAAGTCHALADPVCQ